MLSGSLEEILATVTLAVIYLLVVRLLDVNEREPLWSLGLVFALGIVAATVLWATVSSLVLELEVVRGAILREVAVFLALALGIRILSAIGRLRGWPEVNDLVDGLVYGIAAGLGFAAGEAVARGIWPTTIIGLPEGHAVTVLAKTALAGLSEGVFGAVTGAGFGLALSRRLRGRWVWPLVSLALAIALHAAHHLLAYGNALGGPSAVLRGWLALTIPIAAVAALAIYGLATEQRAIARELADETAGGFVTEPELRLLRSFVTRQLTYLRALMSGRLGQLGSLQALHNRQVMLALAKRRANREPDAQRRTSVLDEIDALRRSILTLREALARTESRHASGAKS
jgi:RsiW-degrading membrane proteinase PrsW (M82 family)